MEILYFSPIRMLRSGAVNSKLTLCTGSHLSRQALTGLLFSLTHYASDLFLPQRMRAFSQGRDENECDRSFL